MDTSLIAAATRAVTGREVTGLTALSGGGMNQTYRADLGDSDPVVVRAALHPQPWFTQESALMTAARAAGIPTAEVLGVEHHEVEGGVWSASIQRLLPGRALDRLDGLDREQFGRLIEDSGELLARIHTVETDRGIAHPLTPPGRITIERVRRLVEGEFGPGAARLIEPAAELVRDAAQRRTPARVLAHGDFLPKNLLVHQGRISGVLDWEFAGPASPAHDLARWQVSAGSPWHDHTARLCRGYARERDPEPAADLIPAFAVAWALEKLSWANPAPRAQRRRCVAIIERHTQAARGRRGGG